MKKLIAVAALLLAPLAAHAQLAPALTPWYSATPPTVCVAATPVYIIAPGFAGAGSMYGNANATLGATSCSKLNGSGGGGGGGTVTGVLGTASQIDCTNSTTTPQCSLDPAIILTSGTTPLSLTGAPAANGALLFFNRTVTGSAFPAGGTMIGWDLLTADTADFFNGEVNHVTKIRCSGAGACTFQSVSSQSGGTASMTTYASTGQTLSTSTAGNVVAAISNTNAAPTANLLNLLSNGAVVAGFNPLGINECTSGASVTAATTIAATGCMFPVTGTAAITTMSVPIGASATSSAEVTLLNTTGTWSATAGTGVGGFKNGFSAAANTMYVCKLDASQLWWCK